MAPRSRKLSLAAQADRKTSQWFLETNKGLFTSGDYSDLVVMCGEKTFNVHKAIVCPRSDFFKMACKPNTFKEGIEGVISLGSKEEPEDVDIVGLMIEYLYCLQYTMSPTDSGEDHALVTHAKTFAIAEKYGVQGLPEYALSRCKKIVWQAPPSDLVEAIAIAHSCAGDGAFDLRHAINGAIFLRYDRFSLAEIAIVIDFVENPNLKSVFRDRLERDEALQPVSEVRIESC